MIVRFDRSFLKALDKIKDQNTLKRIEAVILKAEAIDGFEKLSNTKKLIGFTNYYHNKFHTTIIKQTSPLSTLPE